MADTHVSRRAFLGIAAGASINYALEQRMLAQDAKQEPVKVTDCASAITVLESLPALKKKRIAFDQAKSGTDALKIKYLDQLLVEEYKLIADPKRNPDGFVSAWYYWDDKDHRKKAVEAVRDEMKNIGYENQTDGTVKTITNTMYFYRIMPRLSREGIGHKQKLTYLLVGKELFDDAFSEDELFSRVDEAYVQHAAREFNFLVGGKEFDAKNGALRLYTNYFTALFGARVRLELVLQGKRKRMSEFYEGTIVRNYAKNYNDFLEKLQECAKSVTFEAKGNTITDPYFTQAHETMKAFLKECDESIGRLGYDVKDGKLIKK